MTSASRRILGELNNANKCKRPGKVSPLEVVIIFSSVSTAIVSRGKLTLLSSCVVLWAELSEAWCQISTLLLSDSGT